MKLTANDLKDLHIAEQIICEPEHFTVENFGEICRELEKQIAVFLDIQKKSGGIVRLKNDPIRKRRAL